MHSEQFSTTLPPDFIQSDSSMSFLQKPSMQQHFLPIDLVSMMNLHEGPNFFLSKDKQAAGMVNPTQREGYSFAPRSKSAVTM